MVAELDAHPEPAPSTIEVSDSAVDAAATTTADECAQEERQTVTETV